MPWCQWCRIPKPLYMRKYTGRRSTDISISNPETEGRGGGGEGERERQREERRDNNHSNKPPRSLEGN